MWRHPAQGKANHHCPFHSFTGEHLCTDRHTYVHVICVDSLDVKQNFLETQGLWLISPTLTNETESIAYNDLLDGAHKNPLLPCEGVAWQDLKSWV